MTERANPPAGAGADAATAGADAATGSSAGHYVRPVLFAALVAALVVLCWWVRSVFLLLFGALILATALRSASRRFERHAGLSRRSSFALTLTLLVVTAVSGSWLIGDRLASQFGELQERLPAAAEAARAWLDDHALGQRLAQAWSSVQDGGFSWEGIRGAAGITAGAIGNAALIIVMGIFIAAVVVFGLLFGVMGVIFATPLMVVLMILVKKLYVHDVLEAQVVTAREQRQAG